MAGLICPNATFQEIDGITQCNPSEHNLSDGIYFFNESGTSTIIGLENGLTLLLMLTIYFA